MEVKATVQQSGHAGKGMSEEEGNFSVNEVWWRQVVVAGGAARQARQAGSV